MDVGASLSAKLTDGRVIGGTLTFGDIARAEMQAGINFMQKMQVQEGITLVDLAQLTYQVARRTGYTQDLNQWLLDLDTFEVEEDETPATNGATASPFPTAVQEGW